MIQPTVCNLHEIVRSNPTNVKTVGYSTALEKQVILQHTWRDKLFCSILGETSYFAAYLEKQVILWHTFRSSHGIGCNRPWGVGDGRPRGAAVLARGFTAHSNLQERALGNIDI